MNQENFITTLHDNGLNILGACAPKPSDGLLEDFGQILLIGPDEPRFWEIFSTSPEFLQKAQNPLDKWSKRVICNIASNIINSSQEEDEALALFPFEGPPYYPFIQWALRSQSCFSSPVNLLVHYERGLFVSFRAAIALKSPIALDLAPQTSPCETCTTKPCIKACPIDALTPKTYDTTSCYDYLESDDNLECLSGCLVRRACPIGHKLRDPKQSNHHMQHFLANRPR